MKKLFTAVLLILALSLSACTSSRYKAVGLTEKNDGSGWSCSFNSLDGDYAKGFNINSSRLRIESSAESGKITVYITGNGENVSFDGKALDESVSAEKFGDGVLYVTLKCENAKNGKVHIVWEE